MSTTNITENVVRSLSSPVANSQNHHVTQSNNHSENSTGFVHVFHSQIRAKWDSFCITALPSSKPNSMNTSTDFIKTN